MPQLEIDIKDRAFIDSLKQDTPPGVSILTKVSLKESFGVGGDILAVIIKFGPDVITTISLSLISAWLYDKLKKHGARQITINRKEIHLTEGNITKIIEEMIQIED